MTIKLYELCGADRTVLFSPHCWKTRMSLAHKGLAFETVPTPFTGIPHIEGGDYKSVPVLRDGDTVLRESLDIAAYLDETYPDKPSLLGGPAGAALTKFVIGWSQTQLHMIVTRLALMDIYELLDPADHAYFRETREKLFGMSLEDFQAQNPATAAELGKALTPLAGTLKQQPFIGGDNPLFADYIVFGALQWLRTTRGEGDLPAEGPVAEWFARLLDMYSGVGRNVPVGRAA